MKFQVVRYAHLDVRTMRGHRDSIWFKSYLTSSGFELAWVHSSGFLRVDLRHPVYRDMILQFGDPEHLREKLDEETTRFSMSGHLGDLYALYSRQSNRNAFDSHLIQDLSTEDRQRKDVAQAAWVILDAKGGAAMMWMLFQNESHQSEFEIGRLAKFKQDIGIPLDVILPLISEYFEARGITEGRISARSDALGMRYYRRFGFRVDREYTPGKFEAHIDVKEFIKAFPAPRIEAGHRTLREISIMDDIYYR